MFYITSLICLQTVATNYLEYFREQLAENSIDREREEEIIIISRVIRAVSLLNENHSRVHEAFCS